MDNLGFDGVEKGQAPAVRMEAVDAEAGHNPPAAQDPNAPIKVATAPPPSVPLQNEVPQGAVPISYPIVPLVAASKGSNGPLPDTATQDPAASSVVRQRFDKSADGVKAKDESNSDDDTEDHSLLSYFTWGSKIRKRVQHWQGTQWPRILLYSTLFTVYVLYLLAVLSISSSIEAEDYWCSGDGFLIILSLFAAILLLYFQVIKKYAGQRVYKSVLKPLKTFFDESFEFKSVRVALYASLLTVLVVFLIADTEGDRGRLQSLLGIAVLLLFGFIFSAAPQKVVWRHVMWGMALQFVLGVFILRFPLGRAMFACSGAKIQALLAFTDKGTGFVFGRLIGTDTSAPIFAFYVLPVILFFSFLVQILYYYGIMQWVVIKIGWLLQVTIGTTACESVNAAANIFLGMSEAPLMIKPFLPVMTKSELHAVLTGGFATIAGSVMAAYISFGISASHLLSASVMSAPAALAYAKLFYPETGVSKTNAKDIPVLKSTEVNALHAAIEGVVTAIPLVANIAANLIAFIAFIALFNSVFNWACLLVDIEDGVCSLENISGYVFMPLAWTMGVQWSDCHAVGTLIGIKTIVNEFVGFSTLAEMVKNGQLSVRSEIIATYALCGFSNISSIGIQMGAMGSLAPERRPDIAKIVVRAMVAGSAACFLTACVAGTLISDVTMSRDLNATFTS